MPIFNFVCRGQQSLRKGPSKKIKPPSKSEGGLIVRTIRLFSGLSGPVHNKYHAATL